MLSGYKVLITGATSGLGLATAKEFVAQGADVIGIGRNIEKVSDWNEHFIPCRCDVTKEEDIDAALEFVKEKFDGKLDAMILNAGYGKSIPVKEISADDLDQHYETLVKANVLFVQKFVPLMKGSANPSISFTASVAGLMVDSSFPYNMMKSAVISFSRQCAQQLKGIRSNAVCPGLIHTPIMPEEAWSALSTEEALQQIPSGRIGKPEEVAKLFAFLASEKASYISGAIITIDGGWYTTHPRVL